MSLFLNILFSDDTVSYSIYTNPHVPEKYHSSCRPFSKSCSTSSTNQTPPEASSSSINAPGMSPGGRWTLQVLTSCRGADVISANYSDWSTMDYNEARPIAQSLCDRRHVHGAKTHPRPHPVGMWEDPVRQGECLEFFFYFLLLMRREEIYWEDYSFVMEGPKCFCSVAFLLFLS